MRELFVVEGVSAASTVRQAMHKPSQAVLATRGKMINANKHTVSRVRNNLACKDIIDVLECGFGEQCNVDHLAYSAVVLLTDPDSDGAHARALLVALFARYFQPLIDAEKVYVVAPPVFRISAGINQSDYFAATQRECRKMVSNLVGNSVQPKQSSGLVAKDQSVVFGRDGFDQSEQVLTKSNHSDTPTITRLKGVAQFSTEQCATLLLNPKSPYRFRLREDSAEGS